VDFICACLLLFLWIVRPQDILAVIGGVSVVKYLMYGGIVATLRRPGGFNVSKMFACPMDWLVTAYCAWAIYVTTDHMAAAKEVFTYFSFHMVTALALTTWRRMETYINVWLTCLGALALLAMSTHWGFEIVGGSAELTTIFHERLTLNTWVFRNPNALGHGVIALLTAGTVWFLLPGAKNRVLGVVMIALAVNTVYLTQSKGAYLAAAGGLTLLMLFKRPVWLQLAVLAVVYVGGLAVLKTLPRMDTLSKNDAGIQGRMIVWQQAKASMESTKTGEGLKQFQGFVAVRIAKLHRTIHVPIATHGSYVRHGADLGYVGVMLFAGIFYGGVRLLMQARTPPESRERHIQRAIYGLLVTMAISCWVVDRAYHMDFFLLSGLLSAFHRKFQPQPRPAEEEAAQPAIPDIAPVPDVGEDGQTGAVLVPASAPSAGSAAALAGEADDGESKEDGPPLATDDDDDDENALKLIWRRLGFLDLVIMYALMEAVVYYWELFSTDFVVF
jgi:hypothetical protein